MNWMFGFKAEAVFDGISWARKPRCYWLALGWIEMNISTRICWGQHMVLGEDVVSRNVHNFVYP